jgi:2-oxoglutarate ferredoxin oxidoreductase subunit alpha
MQGINNMKKELITGNHALVRGAIASGANMMTGYPITPTTEVLEYWSELALHNPELKYLQSEDEMSAGFMMIGGVLAGKKAFSATAGPGNILMQDAIVMAENMRLPIVVFINQRGGPSTGTVIYSQQELNLTCFGGNGEGLRIVYSCSSVQEMYDYSIKAFNTAWKYRFPTFVLSDGYLAKTLTEIETYEAEEKQIETIPSSAYLLNDNKEPGKYSNLRNTYNLENELGQLLEKHNQDFQSIVTEIVEFEDYKTLDAEIVIFAHGIVASAAKNAIDKLRQDDVKVGLFRPITLNPFPKDTANSIIKNKKIILVVESSLGQFERMVKSNIYGENVPVKKLLKPAEGITSEEIVLRVKDLLKEIK